MTTNLLQHHNGKPSIHPRRSAMADVEFDPRFSAGRSKSLKLRCASLKRFEHLTPNSNPGSPCPVRVTSRRRSKPAIMSGLPPTADVKVASQTSHPASAVARWRAAIRARLRAEVASDAGQARHIMNQTSRRPRSFPVPPRLGFTLAAIPLDPTPAINALSARECAPTTPRDALVQLTNSSACISAACSPPASRPPSRSAPA
jgi:hypothetical protein